MDDLHVIGATHWEDERTVNVAVRDRVFRRIDESSLGETAGESLNASGFVITPSFVEPHYHLDKVLITEGSRPNATFEQQVEAVAQSKRAYTEEGVAERAGEVAKIMALRGISRVRSFADVDSFAGLIALRGLLRIREQLRDLIYIQIAAFPQHGLLSDPGTVDRLREALDLGADLLGGHPQLEAREAEGRKQIETLFDLAGEYNIDLDFHVDENDRPDSRWLDAVIAATIERGWHGRVCVAHCGSLAKRSAAERLIVYNGLRDAHITVVSSPTSGLLFRGHGDIDPTRGIVPVRELIEHGVSVACAQEVYRSIFAPNLRYPDPLYTAQVMAYAAKLSDDAGLKAVWRMITSTPAKAQHDEAYGLAVGCRADFLLIKGTSVVDILTRLSQTRSVFRAGRLVAQSSHEESLLASGVELNRS